MENQEQVQPRRSQRPRKSVDRLQLEGRRRNDSKRINYDKHRRQREQKAAEKRKRDLEADSLDSQPKSKKAKIQETKKKFSEFLRLIAMRKGDEPVLRREF